MNGGFQGNDSGITKEKVEEFLKDISVLETRKKNIEKELESFYTDARAKIEKERIVMISELEQKSLDISKKYDKLSAEIKSFDEYKKLEDSRLGALKFELDQRFEKLEVDNKDYVSKQEEFEKRKEKAIKFFDDKDKFYQEKASELEIKQKELKTRDDSSLALMEELGKKEIELKKEADSLTILSKNLDAQLDNVAKQILELEQETTKYQNSNLEMRDKIVKTDIALKDASIKLSDADKLIKDNELKKAELKVMENTLVKDKEALSKWRDELNEKNISLDEKDKSMLLREREIDKKIKILNDLRRG